MLTHIDLFAASGEPSDRVCKIVDAAASLKYDVWKHFGFTMEERRDDDMQTVNNMQLLPSYTSTHPQH